MTIVFHSPYYMYMYIAFVPTTLCVARRLHCHGLDRTEFRGGGDGGGVKGGVARLVVRSTDHHGSGRMGTLHIPGASTTTTTVHKFKFRWESQWCFLWLRYNSYRLNMHSADVSSALKSHVFVRYILADPDPIPLNRLLICLDWSFLLAKIVVSE